MDRNNTIADLVEFRRPLGETLHKLRLLPQGSEKELVVLGPDQLRHILTLFLSGDIPAQQLHDWATAIESCDDIAFTSHEVINIVTRLAHPHLHQPLTTPVVNQLLQHVNNLH